MPHKLTIRSITPVTHDVHHFKLEKPEGYDFKPGDSTMLSIAMEGWKGKKRPFTFTSLPQDDFLEFTIKHYPEHDGVTDKLRSLKTGDALLIEEPWGAIKYKGEGVFIAGGAGITPFISIFRDIRRRDAVPHNMLIFANKKEKDIIIKDELENMPGLTVHHILSEAVHTHHDEGMVDKEYLRERISDFSGNFYICGPKPMQDNVMDALREFGADPDALTFERQE